MRQIDKLVENFTPDVQQAFIDSVGRVTNQARLSDLIGAIEAGNVDRVMDLVKMDPGAFRPYEKAFRDAYGAGGDTAYTALVRQGRAQGVQVGGYFSTDNPEAERFLRLRSSALITNINDNTRQSVRQILSEGARTGTSPRTAALNLVGRVNRATGRREGGVVGMTIQQTRAVSRAQLDLQAGDLAAYKRRALRNRSYDAAIEAAIRETGKVPARLQQRAIRGYQSNLLRQRGETIARTELLGALHNAENDAMGQMLEREGMGNDAVTQTWDASNDADTRDSHRAMDGQQRKRGETFTTGAGYRLAYPGDRGNGAPAEEIINCRCFLNQDVDWTQMLKKGKGGGGLPPPPPPPVPPTPAPAPKPPVRTPRRRKTIPTGANEKLMDPRAGNMAAQFLQRTAPMQKAMDDADQRRIAAIQRYRDDPTRENGAASQQAYRDYTDAQKQATENSQRFLNGGFDNKGKTVFAGGDGKGHEAKKSYRDAADAVRNIVSPTLLPQVRVKFLPPNGRAYYDLKGTVHVTKRERAPILAHEAIHDIEIQHPRVLERTVAFLRKRAEGKGRVKYKGEEGYKDKWTSRGSSQYAGRDYSQRRPGASDRFSVEPDRITYATEILTMGIERLMKNPLKFAKDDPEYFDFILRVFWDVE